MEENNKKERKKEKGEKMGLKMFLSISKWMVSFQVLKYWNPARRNSLDQVLCLWLCEAPLYYRGSSCGNLRLCKLRHMATLIGKGKSRQTTNLHRRRAAGQGLNQTADSGPPTSDQATSESYTHWAYPPTTGWRAPVLPVLRWDCLGDTRLFFVSYVCFTPNHCDKVTLKILERDRIVLWFISTHPTPSPNDSWLKLSLGFFSDSTVLWRSHSQWKTQDLLTVHVNSRLYLG